MNNPAYQFSDAMQSAFGRVDFSPIPDGNIHRFHVPGDKAGARNGWYVLHTDGIASGAFGSWKTGESHTWCSRKPVNILEVELIRQQMAKARRQRDEEQHQRQQKAAERAGKLWRESSDADHEHPYLTAKEVQPLGLRQCGELLLVPLLHGGELLNLQTIQPDGSKRFLSGGKVKGCHSMIGEPEHGGRLYLCEGWATGATIHRETGDAVACAMNAGNLLEAGRELLRAYPDALLIVAADDDRQTLSNPGKTAAIQAAEALGCGLVLPQWPDDAPLHLSDFNDLQRWRGAQ